MSSMLLPKHLFIPIGCCGLSIPIILGEYTMKYYILYGKTEDMARFMPLDLSEGNFVKNIMFASLFNDRAKAEKVAYKLMEQNKGLIIEVRKHN